VTEDGLSIRGPLLHVDGANQTRFTDLSIHYDPATGRCSGDCHGEKHESERWRHPLSEKHWRRGLIDLDTILATGAEI